MQFLLQYDIYHNMYSVWKHNLPRRTTTFALELFTFAFIIGIRHFSLLNVNVAGACGYDFRCDGGRLVRAYLRR